MDLLDKQILMELSNDCRISYSHLAQKHNVSANTIKNRVRILEEKGIIERFTFEFNPSLMNANTVLILFKFHNQPSENLINQLGMHPLVTGIGAGVEAGFAIGFYRNHTEISLLSDVFHSVDKIREVSIFPVLLPLTADQLSPMGTLSDIKRLDWSILSHLRENGRITLSELSKKTHISVKTIRKRLKSLQERNMIRLTIQLNPGKISRGMMVLILVELNKLTRQNRVSIDNEIRRTRPDHFWVSWQVVDRPIIILAFQAENVDEVKSIQEDVLSKVPDIQTTSHLVGGSIRYYPDFTDELLETHQKK